MNAKTILLVIVAIAGLCWALSSNISGLAWFPGALVSITAALGAYDAARKDKEEA